MYGILQSALQSAWFLSVSSQGGNSTYPEKSAEDYLWGDQQFAVFTDEIGQIGFFSTSRSTNTLCTLAVLVVGHL